MTNLNDSPISEIATDELVEVTIRARVIVVDPEDGRYADRIVVVSMAGRKYWLAADRADVVIERAEIVRGMLDASGEHEPTFVRCENADESRCCRCRLPVDHRGGCRFVRLDRDEPIRDEVRAVIAAAKARFESERPVAS